MIWKARYLLQIGAALMAAGSTVANASFETVVQPFLNQHCTQCHGAEKQKAKLTLHNRSSSAIGSADAEVWNSVIEAIAFGEMPPAEEARPDEAEAAEVVAFLQAQLAAAGRDSDLAHKLQQPAYANLLNHEQLFDGSQTGPAFSPPRLWRLHPEAYESFLAGMGRELGQGGPLSKPFVAKEGKGEASNFAALVQADSAALGQLMLNCRKIATFQTEGFKKPQKDRKTGEMVERTIRRVPKSFEAIIGADALDDGLLQAAVSEEFQIVLSRSPTADELEQYTNLLRRSIDIGGSQRGLHTMAMAVLLRPDAIYRMEIGLGAADEHGRRMLSPYELAHAIAYALTDTPPDLILLGPMKGKRPMPPTLLDLAESGELTTREDVARIVEQIWQREEILKPRILRFFHEFFGYHTAPLVFKGDRGSRAFHVKHLVRDADHLVEHIVREDRDVLKELLTTDRFFVEWAGSEENYDKRIKYITDRIKPEKKNDVQYKYFITRSEQGLKPMPQANPTWRTTVRFYNLHEDKWDYPLAQPFQMPKGQRAGLLTHPAWLVAWSGNFGNDPIRRGKWIREHLLAGTVPEIPIEVDAQVPEDPAKTLRDRLKVTRQDYCWKCHLKMEPLGLPFEAYNDFGQFRTEEGIGGTKALAKPKQVLPVVSAGHVYQSGDPALDGEVADVQELMQRLAASPRVRQSFVRHAFRYWMGRNEQLSDSPVLMEADKRYVENSGSFKQLVFSLLTSDAFLYRK